MQFVSKLPNDSSSRKKKQNPVLMGRQIRENVLYRKDKESIEKKQNYYEKGEIQR